MKLRAFLLSFLSSLTLRAAEPVRTQASVPVEIIFTAQRSHADPFNDVTLDVIFSNAAGVERKVPAFWAGGDKWKVRFAATSSTAHPWQSQCNDTADAGLHGVTGTVEILAYAGDNPLFKHGPVRVAPNHRSFEHADGTPFFWLGDTWWMGLCHRLHWPDEFQRLTADRKAKGFTVVQIVAGLYPDMHPFDPRGANEAGFPWEKDYARIRPEYFDAADARLRYLVDQGITPCIVGAWGYLMPWMGPEKLKAHWRYLIARYSAWPVIWCAAGEANLPWYQAKNFPSDDRTQVHGWTDVLRSIRATDPFRRPLTIHPTGIGRLSARNATDDVALLDFDMLQTPHGQREAVPPTVRTMRESYPDKPVMPIINGEAAYEMLNDQIPAQWPRAMFWVCMMNGAAGHTYGANGIWQVNRKGQPHGPSPTAGSPPNGYGATPWEEAMNFAGSSQVAHGKRFFGSLPWPQLTPMADTVAWADSPDAVPPGDWIWHAEGDPKRDAPVAVRYFRRSFDVADKARLVRATLRVATDDRGTVWLNGEELGSCADWGKPTILNVSHSLRTGRNVLCIRAENVRAPVTLNPAGLNASLSIELNDGTKTTVTSDAQWRSATAEAAGWQDSAFDDSQWPAAIVIAKYGDAPWGRTGESDPLTAPQACGIADKLRAIYVLDPRAIVVRKLKPNAKYRLTHFDPVSGERAEAPDMTADAKGEWRGDPPAHGHDWVLLLSIK